MANEVNVANSISFAKGNVVSVARALASKGVNVAGAKYVQGVQNIGTAAEAISIGDLGTPGWFWAKNIDATNFITIRTGAAGADVVKLLPLESCLFRLAASNPYAIADTGACNLEYLIVEA